MRLKEMLLSIPKHSAIEVIVIDDWTENNKTHISKLKEEFPDVVFLENDINKKGAGAARNVGLRNATGKWVLFADSDDVFLPNLFKKIFKYLDTNYDVIYFAPTSFMDDRQNSSRRHVSYENYILNYIENKNRLNELKLRYYFFVPWSKLIKRQIIIDKNITFDEVMVSNDVQFSTKIGFYADNIFATKEVIYSVRESTDSLTSIVTEKSFRQRVEVWMNYVSFIRENLPYDDYKHLDVSASSNLLNAFRSKLGLKNIGYIIRKAIEYKVPLIDKRIFNLYNLKGFLSNKIQIKHHDS